MALCKNCEKFYIQFVGQDGSKCSCGKEIKNAINKVCEECSLSKELCEHCGGPICKIQAVKMPERCPGCGELLLTTGFHICLTHGPMV